LGRYLSHGAAWHPAFTQEAMPGPTLMAPTLWLGENAVMAHQGFQLCLAYMNGVAIPNGDHDELMAKHTSCLKEDDFFTT